MADNNFTAITTQEEFDKAIAKRLAQKDRELADKYRDYLSPDKKDALIEEYDKRLSEAAAQYEEAQGKLAKHDAEVAELMKRATDAESTLTKHRIAHENGVPYELAGRLIGDTEEELTADAKTLAGFTNQRSTAPMFTHDHGGSGAGIDANDAAYASLLASLTAQS